jgi:hypothetical protein
MRTGTKVLNRVENEAELVPPEMTFATDVEVSLLRAEPTLGSSALVFY